MKREWAGLSRQYQAALRTHLKRSRPVSLRPARDLGRRAMTVGLETLDLARIHERRVDRTCPAGLLSRRPGGDGPAGGSFFCRGHHPD